MTWYINKQEAETLKGLLPPDVIVVKAEEIGTDNVIQGVEKSRMYERKELKDFLASVHDGRIFEQLKDLSNNKENYEPFVILEGLGFYDWTIKKWMRLDDYFVAHPERKVSFYEALTAFRAFGVGLVLTMDKADTALYLTHQNLKLGKPKVKKEYPERRGFRKDWDNEKKKHYLLEAFGPTIATTLIKRFGTIDDMCHILGQVPDRQTFLSNVTLPSGRRIGDVKAKEIIAVLFT
jgi:ERCC4-type nuclease